MERLTFLCKDGEFDFYSFVPTNRELFWKQYYPYGRSLLQIFRFLYEKYKNDYKVIYMFFGVNMVGFCVVHNGGGRYTFISKDDLVIGPYFIDPKCRGKGYSIKLLKMVVEEILPKNKCVYDYINKNNIPSIRASEAIGMVAVDGLSINHLTHRMSLAPLEESEFLLYKYLRNGRKK